MIIYILSAFFLIISCFFRVVECARPVGNYQLVSKSQLSKSTSDAALLKKLHGTRQQNPCNLPRDIPTSPEGAGVAIEYLEKNRKEEKKLYESRRSDVDFDSSYGEYGDQMVPSRKQLHFFMESMGSPATAAVAAVARLQDQQSEANALCAFKLGISNWPSSTFTGWNCNSATATASSYPCGAGSVAWTGVTCSGSSVSQLDLSGKGFQGTISSSISALTGLITLYLYQNSLSKTIPSQVSALTNLQGLYLDHNKLTGSIPSQISALGNSLTTLPLWSNSLSKTIPSEISALTKLQKLYLHINKLTGTIPLQISSLSSSLLELWLNQNSLSKTIPNEISKLTKLQYFLLYSNKLTGVFVSSFCMPSILNGQLQIANNSLSCINPCIQYKDGSTCGYPYYDCDTPVTSTCGQPSSQPSILPSSQPSSSPSMQPSIYPSSIPSCQPSSNPSGQPSSLPSMQPSMQPSSQPSSQPSRQPSSKPSTPPSSQPSTMPSVAPMSSQQQSGASALCAFKRGITNWPGFCTISGWNCIGATATSVACTGSLSSWTGVSCGNNSAVSLELIGCGFTGTISSQISKLNKLSEVDLSSNSLTGPIPSQISALAVLDSLWLNSNQLTGPAGDFLCLKSLNESTVGPTPLQLQDNDFSCIASCAQAIAGPGYYDASSLVCLAPTIGPTLIPTDAPSDYTTASQNEEGLHFNFFVGMDYIYISIMVIVVALPIGLGYLVKKNRAIHKLEDINEVGVADIFFWPFVSYIFLGNWIFALYLSFSVNSSREGILVDNILSIMLTLSPVLFTGYINRHIKDPVIVGSLFHKLDNDKSIKLDDLQFEFFVMSLLTFVSPDSIKLLPWRRSTFTDISGGYPSYWVFRYLLIFQLCFSFISLILSIVRLALKEVTAVSIVNLLLSILSFISMKASDLYILMRGRLLHTYQIYDDGDDEKRKDAERQLSTGMAMKELSSSDLLKSVRDSFKEENVDVIVDYYNIIKAEQVAVSDHATSVDVDLEKQVEKKRPDSTSSSSSSHQDIAILSNQLKDLGVEALKFIPLEDIKAEMGTLLKALNDTGKMDESRFDYLMRCMNVNSEYLEEKRQQTFIWRQEVSPKLQEWSSEMQKCVPSRINKMSVQELVNKGLSKVLATRLTTKKCLWLIKMDAEKIRKIHKADLSGKYSYQCQNLDIVELAAIYMSLPTTFENDTKGDKMKFRTELEDKLKVTYNEYKQNKLKAILVRNPAYGNVNLSKLGIDVEQRLTFSEDSKPSLIETLEGSETENPMFSTSIEKSVLQKKLDGNKNTANHRDLGGRSEDVNRIDRVPESSSDNNKPSVGKSRVTAPPGLLDALKKKGNQGSSEANNGEKTSPKNTVNATPSDTTSVGKTASTLTNALTATSTPPAAIPVRIMPPVGLLDALNNRNNSLLKKKIPNKSDLKSEGTD